MRQSTSITGCVRRSVAWSVGRSVGNAFVRRSTRRTLLTYLALFLLYIIQFDVETKEDCLLDITCHLLALFSILKEDREKPYCFDAAHNARVPFSYLRDVLSLFSSFCVLNPIFAFRRFIHFYSHATRLCILLCLSGGGRSVS